MSKLRGGMALVGKGYQIRIETGNWVSIEPHSLMELTESAMRTAHGIAPDRIITGGLFYS
jgi:hypothetical protein